MTEAGKKNKGMHPGVAAAIGAVIGAAGGIAAYSLYQKPEIREQAQKKMAQLKDKAQERWEDFNKTDIQTMKEKADDMLEDGKKAVKRAK